MIADTLETDIEFAESTKWSLEDGIAMSRRIEALLTPAGFHCALGGSVLHSGVSLKDLDIFVYPHKSTGEPISDVEVLTALFPLLPNGWKQCNHSQYGDEKRVFYCYTEGKRIDFFLLP